LREGKGKNESTLIMPLANVLVNNCIAVEENTKAFAQKQNTANKSRFELKLSTVDLKSMNRVR